MMLAFMMSFIGCDFNLSDKEDVTFKESESAHVHSFEYVQNAMTHFKQYTCGCPSPDIAGLHYDNDKDELCDECGHRHRHEMCGTWQYDSQYHWCNMSCNWEICDIDPALNEHLNEDMDDKCDVCGYEMLPPPPQTNHFLRNQAGCEWLRSFSAEDIREIRIIDQTVGIAPGSLKHIYSSTDETAISRIFEEYYWLDTAPIPVEDGQIDGGGAITVQFILKDGCVKRLYINNGNYRDSDGNYFKLLYTPGFNYVQEFTSRYGFITYHGVGEVWRSDGSCEPEFVAEIDIDELEFLCGDADLPISVIEIPESFDYTVTTEFGTLRFITPEIFTMPDGTTAYLVGKNLLEIIGDATAPEYSITMNDADWLYEELLPKYKVGEVVSVKIQMAYDLGYLFIMNGERIESCRYSSGDYWEFTFTMPECDVVIDFKTYDGFLPHRNYSVLIETYWMQNLHANHVYVEHYYGEFESGAIVAMINAGGYDDVVWDEAIDGRVFSYTNSNRILVLYEREFYTLTEAYEMGIITPDDLAVIAELHE